MSTLKVNAIRHNGASSDAITLASDASNISIGSSVFHGIKSTLITNGDFSNGTANWTATTSTLSETSGVLTVTPNSGVNGFATQAVTNLVVGKHYNVQVTVTEDAGALSRLYVGTSANGNQNVTNLYLGVGTHSFSFKATATTHYVSLVVGGGTGQATKFDNVRLIESNLITFSTPTGDAPSLRPHAFEGMSINTGGADRLIVSKDGHVTKPNQPCFDASRNAGHVAATNAVIFNSVHVNIGSHYNNSNGRFTAPITGQYYFYFGAIKYNTLTYVRMQLRLNNSSYVHDRELRFDDGDAYGENGAMSIITTLTANDYVQVYVTEGTIFGTNSKYTFFGGYLLS